MLVWFLSNYPKNELIINDYSIKIEQSISDKSRNNLENELSSKLLENSYLGHIGKLIEPLFEPLGFDWKMAVAIQTGLAAKEVVVSTLGVLYAIGGDIDENDKGLVAQIRANIPFASAIAFIVFVMIYLPCFAASMVFAKEAGGWKYLGYLFIATTITAWIMSFIAYNITLIFFS